MSLKTIHVQTPFKLDLGGGRIVHVGPGMQSVAPEVADHWYTKAHLSNGGLGAVAYAEAQRQQADQAFVAMKEQTALWVMFERATVDAEVAAGMDLSAPAYARFAEPTAEEAETLSPRALDDYREAAQKELDARRAKDEPEPDEFDAMDDQQLREVITARDGKAPRANTGRPKLLLAARGDTGASAEIENGTQTGA